MTRLFLASSAWRIGNRYYRDHSPRHSKHKQQMLYDRSSSLLIKIKARASPNRRFSLSLNSSHSSVDGSSHTWPDALLCFCFYTDSQHTIHTRMNTNVHKDGEKQLAATTSARALSLHWASRSRYRQSFVDRFTAKS